MPIDVVAIEISEDPAAVRCPVCETEMHFCQVCGVKAVACRSCLGLLLDGESLSSIVKHLRSLYHGPEEIPRPLDPDGERVRRLCPACLTAMDNHPYYGPGNIFVDSCRDCYLTWLDRDELKKIVLAPGKR